MAKYLWAESRVSPERPFPAAPESRVSPEWPKALNSRVPSERGKNSGLTGNSEWETRNLRRGLLSRLTIAFESVTFFLYYERRVRVRVDQGSIPLYTAVGVFDVFSVVAAPPPPPATRLSCATCSPCLTPGVEHITTLTRTHSALGVCLPRCRPESIRFWAFSTRRQDD